MEVALAGPQVNNLHLTLDIHANTSSLYFYKLDTLPDAQ